MGGQMSEDGAPPGQLSEKGWVHAHGDRHFWIPCPAGFPAGHNRDSWAAMMAEAWWEQSGLTYPATAVAALAAMLRRIHEQLYAKVPCHQIWIYLRDPAVPPLPVTIGSWKCRASGPRGCAFSAAPTIRPAPARPISQSSRPETSERASGLCNTGCVKARP